jgi:hypothetical protein
MSFTHVPNLSIPRFRVSNTFPWAYEPLRNHVAQHHPGDLEVFEIGWKALGQARQEMWLKKAELPQISSSQPQPQSWDDEREDFSPERWSSWARILHQSFYPYGGVNRNINDTMQEVRRQLQSLISENINHSGQLFGLPYMPDPYHEQNLCETISEYSAEAILKIEMNAVVTRWKGLIEENGLEQVAVAYFAGSNKRWG